LDGINAGQGFIRQFVAIPLGSGVTVEAQLTGKEEQGGIEVSGHPSHTWVGTGFLVADDVVMTNRHVAEAFSHRPPRKRTWRFKPDMSARIDYMEEFVERGTALMHKLKLQSNSCPLISFQLRIDFNFACRNCMPLNHYLIRKRAGKYT